METCEIIKTDKVKIDEIKKNLISDEKIEDAADILSAMGDPGRFGILSLLLEEELCVCEIGEIIGKSQSATSHQLRVLRNARIVKKRKEGKMVYYSLKDEHIKTILKVCLAHIEEEK